MFESNHLSQYFQPFSIRAAAAKSTLTDGSSQEMDQDDDIVIEVPVPKSSTDGGGKEVAKDSNTTSLDTSAAATSNDFIYPVLSATIIRF